MGESRGMWEKIMRYYHLHQVNPDKYPEWRNTIEWSDFKDDLSEWISAIFGSDGLFANMFLFFLNNPILDFLLAFGMAFGAFNLLRSAFKASHI